MAVKITLLFIIQCLFYSMKCSLTDFTCSSDWIYLPRHKRCLFVETTPVPYYATFIKCSFYNMGILANFSEFDAQDKLLLSDSGRLSDSTILWTFEHDSKSNCSTVVFENNAIGSISNASCAQELPFLCQTYSYNKEIGLEYFEIANSQLSASSFYTSSSSIGLLEYRPEFGRLNTVFQKALFEGRGWCSNSSSIKEYFQVDFNRLVEITSVRLQEGMIDECKLWIESYHIEYYQKSVWKVLQNDSSSKKIFYFNNSTNWLDKFLVADAIRIKPMELKSGCEIYPQVYCLRLEIYGTYKTYFQTNPDVQNIIKKEKSLWPSGSYALPKTETGCPGQIYHTTNGYSLRRISNVDAILTNSSSLSYDLSSDFIKENNCLHESNTTDETFPSGEYCVYNYQGDCPYGFSMSKIQCDGYKLQSYMQYEDVFNENDLTQNITIDYNITYCCRNDTNKQSSKFAFTDPFILLPIKNECYQFANTTSSLQSVQYVTQNLIKLLTSGNILPYFTWNNNTNITTQFICYYQPDNNADQIEISRNGSRYISTYIEFDLNIKIKSKGSLVTSGVDAFGMIIVHGQSCNRSVWKLTVQMGSVALTTTACEEAVITFKVQMNTTLGLIISSEIQLTFSKQYNSYLLINSNFSETNIRNNITNIHTFISSQPYDILKSISDKFKSDIQNPQRLHNLMVISPKDTINTLASIAQSYNIPLLVYQDTPSWIQREPPQIRYMTISANNNFLSVLASIDSHSSVVIYRTKGVLSFAEYHAMFLRHIKLQADVVLSDEVNRKHLDHIFIAQHCKIFLFLDSILTSALLRKSIEFGYDQTKNHTWYSFAPNYVVSNTFITGECQSVNPPCYVAFKNMRNIFYEQEITCHTSSLVEHILSHDVKDLKQLIEIDLIGIVVRDMLNVSSQFLEKTISENGSLSTKQFLNYVNSLSCLPSGSGLSFYTKQIPEYKKIKENFMCQPGWSGILCNIPVCSSLSCNTTHGVCIAPETCQCKEGRYNWNCNGDCQQSCINGVCNDGAFGDGLCTSCDWLYLGDRCTDKSIVYGLVAAILGTGIVAIFVTMYIVKVLQTQEQTAEAEIEASETDHTMKWEDFEYVEDVDYSGKVALIQLKKKIRYTTYKKGTTFSGQDVFIKTFQKPHFQLSLSLKTELNKLCKLDHGNVERLLGMIISKPTVSIVTQTARMGSLYDVLHEKHIPITWDVKYSMMQDICRGMSYLHDVMKIEHGRLKSTNCLLHQGWLVKVTDIGLRKVKGLAHAKRLKLVGFAFGIDGKLEQSKTPALKNKRRSSLLSENEDDDSDYSSLLWTAPEFLNAGAISLDQITRVTPQADIYSFGIIIAEIISRRPPFSENTVMAIPHIVQAVGRIREPILNLNQFNKTGEDTSYKDQPKDMLRPTIEDSLCPKEEPEKSILCSLMESSWAEEPENRPPFSYSLEVLEQITPLKGSQTLKRAVLLERESESLEQYIGHDTQEIFKEKEKFQDLLSRVLPTVIAKEYQEHEKIKPQLFENVTIMVARISNFPEIISACSPVQAVALVDYLWATMQIIIDQHKLRIVEINSKGDMHVLGRIYFLDDVIKNC